MTEITLNSNETAVQIANKGWSSPLGDEDSKADSIADEPAKDKEEGPKPVPFHKLFAFASCCDGLLMIIGTVAAIVGSACIPFAIVLFGNIADAFVFNAMNESLSNSSWHPPKVDFMEAVTEFAIFNSILGLAEFVLSFLYVMTFNSAAERQAFRIRKLYFKSILYQDMEWYDTHNIGDFSSRVTDDLNKFQEGIGEKLGAFFYLISMAFVSCGIAFWFGWKLTLVSLSALPLMLVIGGIVSVFQSSIAEREQKACARAGSVAEEALNAIRTVFAFGGQAKELQRYEKELTYAQRAGVKRGMLTGVSEGVMELLSYAGYALSYWYGIQLFIESKANNDTLYTPGVINVVFFNVLTIGYNCGQVATYTEVFSIARGAASSVFEVISRVPMINSGDEKGLTPLEVNGEVEFEEVHFSYPTRPNVKVLQGFNLVVKRGETVALVGSSGCGKSTCINLLQRFYDPTEGLIKLDGVDIKELNLMWLRRCFATVKQEPVLFRTTIAENICFGNEAATEEQIQNAAKEANAHDFIMSLPQKYDTIVGEGGAWLSGGQKQRIAIARALVRDPLVLLLDEATSSLDATNELHVQAALDKARQGRTTIIVAHRLSTIRAANKIVVISNGRVAEIGTHDDLMAVKGHYFNLVTTQVEHKAACETAVDCENTTGSLFQRRHSSGSEDNVSIKSTDSLIPEVKVRRGKGVFKKDKIEDEDGRTTKVPLTRIFKENSEDWPCLLVGCLASILMGSTIPVYAVIFGQFMGVMANETDEEAQRQANFYSLMYVGLALAACVASFLQSYMFTISGENLTFKLRKKAFGTMLQQDMSWFDDDDHATGSLCAVLSSDASKVQGLTGSRVGSALNMFSTMFLSILCGMYFSWKLTFIMLLFAPVLIGSTYFQARIIEEQSNVEREGLMESNKIAVEAVGNIETVASLSLEETFLEKFVNSLLAPHLRALRNAHIRGFIMALTESVPEFAYCACMFYGGYLIHSEKLNYTAIFQATEALIFGMNMVGQAMSIAPDYNKAMFSAGKLFKLFDSKPKFDSSSDTGCKLVRTEGCVGFNNVGFIYPGRPESKVLDDINFSIEERGQSVALVGSSGSGKSTCIQLIQRFYDPTEGTVTFDSCDLKTLSVPFLRSQLALVSQEPVLFNRTIAENIAYGDNTRDVQMDDIIEAAKVANIHNFISSLPAGYGTNVGQKGTQLSGGQKQRIAIARALIRNPRVLLLDEATSALDAENEKVVQEALVRAQEGRTSITIAHRLSTIQHSNKIYVINEGKIVECGTHKTLLTKRGLYYNMCVTQGGVNMQM